MSAHACDTSAWESPNFKSCVWEDMRGVRFPFDSYDNKCFLWKMKVISEFEKRTVPGMVLPCSMVTTRSRPSGNHPPDAGELRSHVSRPSGQEGEQSQSSVLYIGE